MSIFNNVVKHNVRNPNENITYIVDLLEETQSCNVNSFINFHKLNIENQIDLINLWLETTILPYVQRTKHKDNSNWNDNWLKFNKCVAKIDKLSKFQPKRSRLSEASYQGTSWNISNKDGFRSTLTSHNHIEEKKVSIKNNNNEDKPDASCVIQIEEPETKSDYYPLIINYPPDIHYNFRFNFFNMPLQQYPRPVYPVVMPNNVLNQHNFKPILIAPKVAGINCLPQLVPMKPLDNQPKLDYCPAVKKALYPMKLMKSNNEVYMIQQRNDRCICLLCRALLELAKSNWKGHLHGKKHLKNCENNILMDAVVQYHKFWLQQSDEDQMEQIHFEPLSNNYIICTPCQQPVSFDTIIQHMSMSQHIGKIKNIVKFNNKRRFLNNEANDVTNDSTDSMSASTESNSPLSHTSKEVSNKIQHILIKSIVEDIGFFDKLENRLRPHLQHLTEKPDTVICKCCNMQFEKNIQHVKEHILTPSHVGLSKIPNLKHNYFCSMCNIDVKNEKSWIRHYLSKPHIAKLSKINEPTKYTEFECSCGTVTFGDEVSARTHKRVKAFKLTQKVKDIFESNETINLEQNKLLNDSNTLLQLSNNVTKCCQAIEDTLKNIYPLCKAHPFGSRVTGLGNIESDLDVFVDVGLMYNGNNSQDATAQKKIIKKVRDLFYKKRQEFTDVNCIPTARTPIIQVFHMPSDIDCDLSFKNGLSVENTKFLRLCIDMDENTKTLILFLKKCTKLQSFNGNISTYALSMMVIFYLQINHHLLPVNTLRKMNQPSELIQDWEAIVYIMTLDEIKKHIEPNTASFKDNLLGLFSFYANFDFKTDVICPLLGQIVKKQQFLQPPNGSALPIEMEAYIKKLPDTEIFRATSPMCVQDPFDLSHNLTKACPESVVIKFKSFCDLITKQLMTLQ